MAENCDADPSTSVVSKCTFQVESCHSTASSGNILSSHETVADDVSIFINDTSIVDDISTADNTCIIDDFVEDTISTNNDETTVVNTICLRKEIEDKSSALNCVTEEEIKANLAKKEENLDLLSLSGSGSNADGSLSQLSTITKISNNDDLNLSSIRTRRCQLINSLRSQLDTSHLSIATEDLNEDESFNVSTSTAIGVTVAYKAGDSDINVTPPFSFHHETVPPAAKFKPSFSISETNQKHGLHSMRDESNQTQYEKAFASLHQVLSSTNTDEILNLYSSKLEAYKEEDDKKFDEIFSQIDNEKKNFLSLVEDDAIGELDEDIKMISGGKMLVASSVSHMVKERNDSTSINDKTLIPSEATVVEPVIPDEKDAKEVPQVAVSSVANVAEENKDKDVENLIIGEEEGVEEDFDEDVLLASDDEQSAEALLKGTVKEPTKSWENFVSKDEDENRDNNDPQWEYLRNLGSDYERYKAVQARWKNLEVPDPKRDMTCRCRNVNRSRVYKESWPLHNQYGKRALRSPDADRRYAKRPRRESCTVLFDWSIQKLIRDVENERQQIEKEQEQRLTELADQQSMDQNKSQRKNDAFIQRMKQRHYMETEALIKDFRLRRDELTESARLKMEALRKAGDEVRQFHEFYPNKNGVNGTHDGNTVIYLTETEVQEILEVENMLLRFESFYSIPA